MSNYGYCPKCGAPGISRERRINGNDTCENGHTYASSSALHDASELVRREDWIWYIVVDDRGDFLEGFNSYAGAEGWRYDYNDGGGHIIPVKEKPN